MIGHDTMSSFYKKLLFMGYLLGLLLLLLPTNSCKKLSMFPLLPIMSIPLMLEYFRSWCYAEHWETDKNKLVGACAAKNWGWRNTDGQQQWSGGSWRPQVKGHRLLHSEAGSRLLLWLGRRSTYSSGLVLLAGGISPGGEWGRC